MTILVVNEQHTLGGVVEASPRWKKSRHG